MHSKSFHLLPIVLLFCLAFSGCSLVQTIYPIRTSDKTMRDPGIEGVWNSLPDRPSFSYESRDDATLTIKRVGGKRYHVEFQREDGRLTYSGHGYLVVLGDRQFLEFELESKEKRYEEIVNPVTRIDNSVKPYFFARVHREEGHMRIGFPRVEEFKKAAETSDDLVGFERGRSFIITSTTEQLQRFLASTDDTMYESSELYVRAKLGMP